MLNLSQLKRYIKDLGDDLVGKYISHPIQYSKDVFLFHVSGKSHKRLTFSLDNPNPFIYLSEESLEAGTLESRFYQSLKKYMSNAYVKDVSIINNDRLLSLSFLYVNDVLKEEKAILIFEMIPHRPNLILLDKEGIIISAFRATAITEKRPIAKGLRYECPATPDFVEPDSDENYVVDTLSIDEIIKSKRKNEKYSKTIHALKNRVKALERKCKNIDLDIKNAESHLEDKEKGDAIYTCFDAINPGQDILQYEGLIIKIDPNKTLVENAQRYYKEARKAKAKLAYSKDSKAKAEKDLEAYKSNLLLLDLAEVEGMEKLEKELNISSKTASNGSKKDKDKLIPVSYMPYCVDYKGTKILFGKNAKENDALTFLLDTHKNHLWLHIEGDFGAHVMIKKENPSDDEISAAASICILSSNRVDGAVMVAKRKDIRKGSVPGEVKLLSYEVIRIERIDSEIQNLFNQATKYQG